MAAYKADIVIDQGATYETSFTVTDSSNNPLDLTGYTGEAQMRKHYTSTNSTSFDVTVANTGAVTLAMNAAVTATLVAGRYVYDCELTSTSNVVSRVVEGIATVSPQVTR